LGAILGSKYLKASAVEVNRYAVDIKKDRTRPSPKPEEVYISQLPKCKKILNSRRIIRFYLQIVVEANDHIDLYR
jgi:hypothetical protein